MTDEAESRLSIHEVPDKLSRIFFGNPQPSYNPSPSSSGYYAPASPSLGSPGFGLPLELYPGFVDDLRLLFKLGHVALIAFLVLAVVLILFIIVASCLYCLVLRRRQDDPHHIHPSQRLRSNRAFGHDVFPESPRAATNVVTAHSTPRVGVGDVTSDPHSRPTQRLTRHSNRHPLNRLSDSTTQSATTDSKLTTKTSSDSSAERERSVPYYELPPNAIPIVPLPFKDEMGDQRRTRAKTLSKMDRDTEMTRDEVDDHNQGYKDDAVWSVGRSRLV